MKTLNAVTVITGGLSIALLTLNLSARIIEGPWQHSTGANERRAEYVADNDGQYGELTVQCSDPWTELCWVRISTGDIFVNDSNPVNPDEDDQFDHFDLLESKVTTGESQQSHNTAKKINDPALN